MRNCCRSRSRGEVQTGREPARLGGQRPGRWHDVDTVRAEDLAGRPDQDVVSASASAGRVLISLDIGLGDIRAYPPGSHAGIVILRLADQSAVSVTKAIGDPASLAQPESLAGAVAVLQRGLLRIRHP